jgi:hypothetical protein
LSSGPPVTIICKSGRYLASRQSNSEKYRVGQPIQPRLVPYQIANADKWLYDKELLLIHAIFLLF